MSKAPKLSYFARRRARQIAEWEAASELKRALDSGEIKSEYIEFLQKLPGNDPHFRTVGVDALRSACSNGLHYPMRERLLNLMPVGQDLNGDGKISLWERLVYLGITVLVGLISTLLGLFV